MNAPIDNAIKRARGYWFVDGFTEMAAGILFVLLAGLLIFSGSSSPASFPSGFWLVASEVSIAKFIGILAAILVLWWLKDNFTYPRTGFVRGKRVTAAQVLIMIRNAIVFLLLPLFGLLAASLLIISPDNVLASMPVWFPIGLGLLWAALFVLAGEWMGLRRFRLIGTTIFLAGVAIGICELTMALPTFPINPLQRIWPPYMLASVNRALASLSFLVLTSGIILTFSGVNTFLRYRKENPIPYTEDE
jgi:hypothetical protein